MIRKRNGSWSKRICGPGYRWQEWRWNINANLLRKWIDAYRREVTPLTTGSPAFAPVMSITTPAALSVALPSGAELDVRGVGPEDLNGDPGQYVV